MLRSISFLAIVSLLFVTLASAQNGPFTLEAVKSYPFPTGLAAAETGNRIVWAFNKEGIRNLYVAEGPKYEASKITNYNQDNGQELSSISISKDGNWIVYIRGGDFGSNWDDAKSVNPTFDPNPPKVQIWSIAFEGGQPNLLGTGENPTISPDGNTVAFVKSNQIWTTPIDGSEAAKQLFSARGNNGSPRWSPSGDRLAFQSNRGGHSFIGIYTNAETPIVWVDPSFDRDSYARWSPDERHLAFVRRPGSGGAPEKILENRHNPWQIRSFDIASGESKNLWTAPETIYGNMPTTHGRVNLHWAHQRIVFLSYQDGWPHLYSIPEDGGDALLLTPGNYMAEYIKLSPDGKWLVFAGNAGQDKLDIDRRHIVKVAVDKAEPEVMTPGDGLEWTPAITGDGLDMVYISATAKRPPTPAVMKLKSKKVNLIAEDLIPKDFPTKDLVTPTQVVYKAPDGTSVHGTLFMSKNGPPKRPAVIYVHGGPPRQMLLGWHYSSYYSNAYALNQYLASQGFAVLSVNYRLGIGYGYDFHRPVDGGTRGASEYQDIKAAGEWLAGQSFIDASRIGIYGGSYGGYLTAMALGRDSDLFAAGVDIHGVHDRTRNRARNYRNPSGYERAQDALKALDVAWESSPVSTVETWTSPVLVIHADDDRNVAFSQSTDLVQRLRKKGVDLETMVIVDDTHHFMMHANQMRVNAATAEYLIRKLQDAMRANTKSGR